MTAYRITKTAPAIGEFTVEAANAQDALVQALDRLGFGARFTIKKVRAACAAKEIEA